VVTTVYDLTAGVAGIARSTCAGGCPRRRRVCRPNHGDLVQSNGTVASQGEVEAICALNRKIVQWLTQSTLAGGRVESGDRGLASPAKQTPIPHSGSFTEVCAVFSEGWTRLGWARLAGLRWQGLGWPRTRRARANAGEFELR
jgi:hypothetical protein